MGIFSHSAEDDVLVSASFPETNPFGLVVNGEQNGLLLHLVNQGTKNYTLVSASASYHDVNNHWATVKNASTLKYNVPIVAGSNLSAPYQVYSEFRPQELGLTVWVNLLDSSSSSTDKGIHQITAMNQTVSVVEPASTWFDPSLLFLYLILSTAILGGAYAVYQTFFNDPSAKKGKGAKGSKKIKAVVPAEEKSVYPNVKPYEEEWIPASHLKNRQSKLKKKGGAGASSGDELVSGGEVTSGGEASGAEGKVRSSKKKGKKA